MIEKIPYLKFLGVNQIQCMPIYEFSEIVGHKTNYWGYGKGYYDRYFAQHEKLIRIGTAYEMQVEEWIKAEETDVKMQFLVTETGIRTFDR